MKKWRRPRYGCNVITAVKNTDDIQQRNQYTALENVTDVNVITLQKR